MYCAKCKRHLAYCNCPDIDERLKDLSGNPHTELLAEQNIEFRKSIVIDSIIETLLNNINNRVKVTFESKKYQGIFYLIGRIFNVSPDYTIFTSEESDYPEGKFDYLNTSRIRSVELI